MINIIQKILNNNITYNLVVPIVIVALNWIKNAYDIRKRNRENGYWRQRFKKGYSFNKLFMNHYLCFFLNLTIMKALQYAISYKISNVFIGILYMLTNFLIMLLAMKRKRAKIELLSNKKIKMILIFWLYLIFGITFYENYFGIVGNILFGSCLIILVIIAEMISDSVFILAKPWANIHLNGGEIIEMVLAGSIRKHGAWLVVDNPQYADGDIYYEEIRIKENNIAWIEYYGEPKIIVNKAKLRRG